MRSKLTSFLSLLFVCAVALMPAVRADSLVGTLPGDVSVDNKGNANYSIPLTLPPSRGGFGPKLSINYSSASGNGHLGLGWSLSSGFAQSITRGRTILARDGQVAAVNFSTSDKFYLDGKRLIAVSGTYGQPNSTYRTEVDSFVTIAATGTGTNIETFVVTDKSGTKMTFGKYSTFNDGYQPAGWENAGLAYAYALKRVEDPLGNFVTFTYEDAGSGEWILKQIDYSPNAAGDTRDQVLLTYTGGRPDKNQSFVGGRFTPLTQRISKITASIKADGARTIISQYSFGYDETGPGSNSKLVSVTPSFLSPTGTALQPLPATTFVWSNNSISFGAAPTGRPIYTPASWSCSVDTCVFGDVDGDGRDEMITVGAGGVTVAHWSGSAFDSGSSWSIYGGAPIFKLCDVNGDGKKDIVFGFPPSWGCGGGQPAGLYVLISDGTKFVPLGGGSGAPTAIYSFGTDFTDPITGGNFYASKEQGGISNRITVADFTGDGRDDILIHRYDGKLVLLQSTGTGFASPVQSDVGANSLSAAFASWEAFSMQFMGYTVSNDFSVTPLAVDLNGDGCMDYVWTETMQNVVSGQWESVQMHKIVNAIMSQPGGGFSQRTQVAERSYTPSSVNPMLFRQNVFCVLPGDLNGDGLTDLLIINPSGTADFPAGSYDSKRSTLDFSVFLSMGGKGIPLFNQVSMSGSFGTEYQVSIDGKQMVPVSDTMDLADFMGSFLKEPTELSDPQQRSLWMSFANQSTMENTSFEDINGDGRADYIWYVTAPGSTGWWVMYSLGTSFSAPARLSVDWPHSDQITFHNFYHTIQSRQSADVNGDGLPDAIAMSGNFTDRPGVDGVQLRTGGRSSVITKVVNGLGCSTSIEYKAAKDDTLYTSGASVAYPIREIRGSNLVVADLYKDSGSSDANRAHFGYQYSGNRLDLSGRGSLGFHSFITIDYQTKIFKYQFLAQSFPMTGLAAREQTYRYWETGSGTSTRTKFRLLSSHDNTVVFDEVVKSLSDSTPWGTVYPFISRAVESRWEDGTSAHYDFGKANPSGGAESKSEAIFPAQMPLGSHITILAQSWFDNQPLSASPQLTNPGNYKPSDVDSGLSASTNNAPTTSMVLVTSETADLNSQATIKTTTLDRDDGWIGRHLYYRPPGGTAWIGWAFDGVAGDPRGGTGSAEWDRSWSMTLNKVGVWQFMVVAYDWQGPNGNSRWGNESIVSVKVPGDGAVLTTPPEIARTYGGSNTVVGSTDYTSFHGLGFPHKIVYGNLTQLRTDYGEGFSETVTTSYKTPVNGLTGLADTISTTVTSPGYGPEAAPVKSYTYFGTTPLIETETVDASDDKLDLKTTYHRDAFGRVTSTEIEGYNTADDQQYIGKYTTATLSDYDDRFDLPKTSQNAYGHTTTSVYDGFFGTPTSVTDPNSQEATTTYDALGRPIEVKKVQASLTSTMEYAFTTAASTGWSTRQTVSGPSGVDAVALSSAYALHTTATVQPPVTTYYDRLGRAIRTIKEGFGTQKTYADTAYDVLGRVVASSSPYPSDGSPLWTKTTYDALGRVSTVTAPNGTVTSNTYIGRATKTSVTATDVAAQINVTYVDAKGRTIKVWSADNDPGSLDPSSGSSAEASIEYKLDGFGRMRETALKGQTQKISATYDPLGRQLSLNDPDKGSWSYINNALGQVVKQTDAVGNVTNTTYDHLGRPLTRSTTEAAGAVETAAWFYYDAATAASTHTVAKGDKGWIGAPQREESSTSGAAGYAASNSATTTVHYYDSLGHPTIDLSTIDGKWFYTYRDYDSSSRLANVRHYWKPAGHETAGDVPYAWQDFGYTYTYDAKSYLLSLKDSAGNLWWEADSTKGYDYLDRPVLVRKGAGYWTQRTYKADDGTLTGITTGSLSGSTVSGTVQDLSFGYDGLGNLTSRGDTLHNLSETYGYDNLNRLTTRGGTTIASYQGNGNIDWKYDVAGNKSASYAYNSPKGTGDTYDSPRPHAVTEAWGYGMTYDSNGNMLTRSKTGETWSTKWTGFDKPRWLAKGAKGSEFVYNAARSRILHLEFDATSAGVPSHYTHKKIYAFGPTVENDYINTAGTGAPSWKLDKTRIYVPGPEGSIGTMEFAGSAKPGKSDRALVYHYDHIGSIESITPYGDTSKNYALDETGLPSRYSYEAWGQRRDAAGWSGAPDKTAHGGKSDLTPRGFTGHEMLDDVGLVHMNGRIYDPLVGRFLSADLVVQFRGDLQSYNRYSYVENNPLTRLDPTGWYSILGLEFTDGGGVGGFVKDLGGYGADVVMGAVGDSMVAGYKSGTEHMASGMTEIANANGALDATIGTLHMVAAVGDAVGVVMNVLPSGKAEQAAANGAEKLAAKAEVAVSEVVSKVEGKGALVENRIEKVATDLNPKVSQAAPMAEVKQATNGAAGGGKTYQTYTKPPKNPETHGTYSGRTSGTKTPEANIANRDSTHHMNDTHGPAVLDKTSSNSKAIRGREQNLIEGNGGAKSQGGTSGNTINGISPKNPKGKIYKAAAEKEFGE